MRANPIQPIQQTQDGAAVQIPGLQTPDPDPAQEPLQPAPEPHAAHPEKPLAQRLRESSDAMLRWLDAIEAKEDAVGQRTQHQGPVVHLGELHCIQKTGKRYAVHRLADLDVIPALEDPSTSIRYSDGRAKVYSNKGQGTER